MVCHVVPNEPDRIGHPPFHDVGRGHAESALCESGRDGGSLADPDLDGARGTPAVGTPGGRREPIHQRSRAIRVGHAGMFMGGKV